MDHLERHDISLAEAISWLAWGRTFSAKDFAVVENRNLYLHAIEFHNAQLTDLNSRYEIIEAEKNSGAIDDEEFRVKILPLSYSYQYTQQELKKNTSLLNWADRVLPEFEKALQGEKYNSETFFKVLSDSCIELYESIKSGEVIALAKITLNDSDWQPIPSRWFWGDSIPTADLEHCSLERKEHIKSEKWVSKWLDVRFERPQILALRSSSSTTHADHVPSRPPKAQARCNEALRALDGQFNKDAPIKIILTQVNRWLEENGQSSVSSTTLNRALGKRPDAIRAKKSERS